MLHLDVAMLLLAVYSLSPAAFTTFSLCSWLLAPHTASTDEDMEVCDVFWQLVGQ